MRKILLLSFFQPVCRRPRSEFRKASPCSGRSRRGSPRLHSPPWKPLIPSESARTCASCPTDLLEGRGTGQRGGDIAAEYIATQFAIYGLKPAGDNGTYMQKVPMVGITPMPETTFSLVPASGAAHEPQGSSTTTSPTIRPSSRNRTSMPPMVYVGYGIDAPEYNWDDYKGADVKGKVLLMLVNEPSSDDVKFFNGKALTYYGRWTYKYEEAARRKGSSGPADSPDRHGQLPVGSRAQLNSGREVVPEAGRHSQVEGCRVGSARRRREAGEVRRTERRQNDDRGAVAGIQACPPAGEVAGPHRQQDSPIRIQ